MGADIEEDLEDASTFYIKEHFSRIGNQSYSIPSQNLLDENDFECLKKGLNVNLPQDDKAIAFLFDGIKRLCKKPPSVLIAKHKFCKKMNDFIFDMLGRKTDWFTGSDHCIYLTFPSEDMVCNIFFQVQSITMEEVKMDSDLHAKLQEAINQCEQHKKVFSVMCDPFLGHEYHAIVVGFPSFPLIGKKNFKEKGICDNCISNIITGDDIKDQESLSAFISRIGLINDSNAENPKVNDMFHKISTLQICACSSIDVPRTHKDFNPSIQSQKERALCILTPDQKSLVEDRSKFIFITGGSGTGKTLVLKERARQLSMEDNGKVLVLNFAGGRLTQDLELYFQGEYWLTLIN